jgi:hypothetical protein
MIIHVLFHFGRLSPSVVCWQCTEFISGDNLARFRAHRRLYIQGLLLRFAITVDACLWWCYLICRCLKDNIWGDMLSLPRVLQ